LPKPRLSPPTSASASQRPTPSSFSGSSKDSGVDIISSDATAKKSIEPQLPNSFPYSALSTSMLPPQACYNEAGDQDWDASATPIRNSLLPSPPSHVYANVYDHLFGKRVRDAYTVSVLRGGYREIRYGAEIAGIWKRGSTPEEAREQWRIRRAVEEAAYEAWTDTEEEEEENVNNVARAHPLKCATSVRAKTGQG
ncbi:hypothetical protein LTR28_012748, partial [Elasticomyces elasticus]